MNFWHVIVDNGLYDDASSIGVCVLVGAYLYFWHISNDFESFYEFFFFSKNHMLLVERILVLHRNMLLHLGT